MNGTKVTARDSLAALMSRFAVIPERQLPAQMPAGAGNKPWRLFDGPFVLPPSDPVDAGPDGPIQLN